MLLNYSCLPIGRFGLVTYTNLRKQKVRRASHSCQSCCFIRTYVLYFGVLGRTRITSAVPAAEPGFKPSTTAAGALPDGN